MRHLAPTLLAILVVVTASSHAMGSESRFEIDGTIGTRFGGTQSVDFEDDDGNTVSAGRISADSALAFGLLASLKVQSQGSVFFSYSRQETTFRYHAGRSFDEGWAIDDSSGTGAIEYFQFGGNLEAPTRLLIPYLGVSVGVTHLQALAGGEGDWTRFNITIDGGLRFEVVPLLDIRVLGRVPFTFPAAELYCFSGQGCAVISGGNPFVQGEFHAGFGLYF
jgi:hypothetical protein